MSLHPLLKVDISELSVAERIQLAEDLWDSILKKQEELPLTEAQQQELDRRLENYHRNPKNGSSWEDVKKTLRLFPIIFTIIFNIA
ncbi:addiction module protein [Aliinostoc sp. HNIBRCY26]|uniref:addiction module protein n=1 Tax=Aliinostoc sp. HNIBRCY26 TaxID=3418997 RepID=UPI003CFE2E81